MQEKSFLTITRTPPHPDYGATCFDCHHHPSDDDSALIACGECHQAPAEDGSQPERCLDCHDEGDIEGTEMASRADAFHMQCIECHEQFEKGPAVRLG
jgi:hypothetical protein